MQPVEKNTVVSMRYSMKNAAGEELANTMNSMPVSYLHGAAGIQALLQAQLEGLKAGDKKTVHLDADSGLVTENFLFEVIIDQVRPALPEELTLGYPVQLPVIPCEAGCDCYGQ